MALPNKRPQGNVKGPFRHDLEVNMFSFLVLSSEFHSLLLENGMASNDSGAIAITNGDG